MRELTNFSMKKLFIVGNWKSNKTTTEALTWFENIKEHKSEIESFNEKTIIVCVAFTLLPVLSEYIKKNNLPIHLCAQDISPFEKGPYTGEVNGEQIKEFAEYALIGHSERRDNFLENNDLLAKKVVQAKKYNLIPIICVQGEKTPVPIDAEIIAYEPPGAISTVSKGIPDNPDDVKKVVDSIKKKYPQKIVIYGGSVNAENVTLFTSQVNIQGVLPGAASLDPQIFFNIIKNA